MNDPVEFEILPIGLLREHERTEEARVEEVRQNISERRVVDEPVLVARGSFVVLNGHHRFAALQALGAERVPVYLVDYDLPAVELGRWGPGPSITKSEVVARAREGRLFPPKTTRHRLAVPVPHRPTPLEVLLPAVATSAPEDGASD